MATNVRFKIRIPMVGEIDTYVSQDTANQAARWLVVGGLTVAAVAAVATVAIAAPGVLPALAAGGAAAIRGRLIS